MIGSEKLYCTQTVQCNNNHPILKICKIIKKNLHGAC